MFRTAAIGIFSLLLFCLPQSARATTLTTCPDCDGDLFAITFQLDSDNGTTSVFDVSLLADTSGNNLGAGHHIDAVAIGINLPVGAVLATLMEFAPNGAANWTAQGGGLSAGGCDGNGAFICAMANANSFAAITPNASTHTTPYEWTFHLSIPDSTPGGPASVFTSAGGDVKVHYSDLQGHLVSDSFTFTNAPPPHENAPPVPEPISSALIGTGLIAFFFVRRRAVR
jgi:hypothetical protein